MDKELEFTVTKLDGDCSGLPSYGEPRFRIGKGENRVWDQEPENTGKGINDPDGWNYNRSRNWSRWYIYLPFGKHRACM